jgi:hypothetical protein
VETLSGIWIQEGAHEEGDVVFERNASEGLKVDAGFYVTVAVCKVAD